MAARMHGGALRIGAWTVAIVIGLSLPKFLGSYYIYVGCLIGVYAIVALGVNLLVGYTGQVSFGHAGFVGLGGYASVLLVQKAGLSYWLAAPTAALMTAAVGAVVGLSAIRIGGLYLSLVTLAFGRIMFLVFLHWRAQTNGYEGLVVERPHVGAAAMADEQLYYLVFVIVVLLVVAARNLVMSRTGRAFIAIRGAQTAAETLGIGVGRYKSLAFAISAFYAGIGGALLPLVTNFINPEMFGSFESALYLLMVILGGMGTVSGPLLGAALMATLPEALRSFKEYQELVYGLIFLGLLLFMPQGLLGLVKNSFSRASTTR